MMRCVSCSSVPLVQLPLVYDVLRCLAEALSLFPLQCLYRSDQPSVIWLSSAYHLAFILLSAGCYLLALIRLSSPGYHPLAVIWLSSGCHLAIIWLSPVWLSYDSSLGHHLRVVWLSSLGYHHTVIWLSSLGYHLKVIWLSSSCPVAFISG